MISLKMAKRILRLIIKRRRIMNHYQHKEDIDITEGYCYRCSESIGLGTNTGTLEGLNVHSGIVCRCDTEALSQDPEMGLDEVYCGGETGRLEAEMLKEMGVA